jgi:membrane-bound lytic murein transglycosylase B
VLDYIDDLVLREHFDRAALLRVFADARYSATAARLVMPASTAAVRRDWNAYRARFVEPVRLAAGFRFWDDNAALLAKAEAEFGVPAEIIVGILGVETVYGRNTGDFRVVDALTTLAFDYPNKTRDRSAFFREQLTDVLRMARDDDVEVATLKGSYAGAIGMPQFMPGSIRSYAIDWDGDGRIDLVGSVADVIGSVANFLVQHGWVRDRPTYLPLTSPAGLDATQAARIDAMVDAGSVPTFSIADLAAAGLATAAPPLEPVALIDLPSGSDAAGRPLVTYLAGTQNFHVITRYNRSYFYAFSVIELGSTIRALRDAR